MLIAVLKPEDELTGFYAKRPDWKRYQGSFDVWTEAHLMHFWDQRVDPLAPSEVCGDPVTRTLMKNGYHLCGCADIDRLEDTVIYCIGHVGADADGENLRDLFNDLAGLLKSGHRPGGGAPLNGAIDARFRLGYDTIFGRKNLWDAAFSGVCDSISLIRRPCLLSGLSIIEGRGDIGAWGTVLRLRSYTIAAKKRVNEFSEGQPRREDSTITQAREVFKDRMIDLYRFNLERAVNTGIPLVQDFLANRGPDEKLLFLLHPYYLRKDFFLDELSGTGAEFANFILPRKVARPAGTPLDREQR